MPRGGHNRKSIERHIADGTYRPGRHEGWTVLPASATVDRCIMCGSRECEESPLGFHPATGAGLCPGCALGGVIFFDQHGWDMVPDDIREKIIAEYLEEQQGAS